MITAKSLYTESDGIYSSIIESCCKDFEKVTMGYRQWSIRKKSDLYLYIGEKCHGHFCPFCYSRVNIIEHKKVS